MDTTIAPSSLMVLMFTDIEGSVEMKTRVGGAEYTRMLARHDELFKGIIASTRGARIIQDTGDGFLARFATGSDAVNAALLFQLGLARTKWEKEPLRVRIGLHLGEVQEIGVGAQAEAESKVVGLPMDLAARLMGLAVGGQVLMTRTIFDDARQYVRALPGLNGTVQAVAESDNHLRWMAHGQYLFKGNPEPMEVFEVGAEGISPLRAPPDSEKARRAVDLTQAETLGWRPAAGLEVPRRSGWLLQRKLGEGGFGEVWLGKHGRTKEQRVFKFCFDSDRLRSFKRELTLFRILRDVLGNRSDIARLYEVQLDAAPYFLETEFSEKGDLGDYAKNAGGVAAIPLDERLEIVARAAESLAAAHSVGVLHKDIKPSNILMYLGEDGKARPRLADFGIGILTDRSKLDGKNITLTGLTEDMLAENQSSRTGTRMYAPPEMLLPGAKFTMQGDVYALGVMLYQMVAGDLQKPLAPGWERDVPDALLRADIAACVAGDLSRRLSNARELAERLRTLPRRRAAARRARLLRLGAASSIVLLAVSLGAGAWAMQERSLRERAEHAEAAEKAQREKVEALRARDIAMTQGLIDDMARRIEPLEGSDAARRWLVEAGEHWADTLAQDAGLDRRTTLELARAYRVMAQLHAGVRGGGGGESGRGAALVEKAAALADRVLAETPGDFSARAVRAVLKLEKATIDQSRRDYAAALAGATAAASDYEALAREKPDDVATARAYASSVQKVGDVQRSLGRMPEAQESYERSLALRRELLAVPGLDITTPDGLRVRRDLAVALIRAADVLREKQPENAKPLYEEGIRLSRELAQAVAAAGEKPAGAGGGEDEGDEPGGAVVRYRRDLAARLTLAGFAFVEMKDLDRAAEWQAEALPIFEALLSDDPTNLRLVKNVAQCWQLAGEIERAREAWDKAAASYAPMLATAARLVRADPLPNLRFHREGVERLALAYKNSGRADAAAAVVRDNLALLDGVLAKAPPAEQDAIRKAIDAMKMLQSEP